MTQSALDPRAYYAQPGPMTDPKQNASKFEDLPPPIPALVEIVQGLVLHVHWAERYGVELPEDRKQEVQLRTVAAKLAHLGELDVQPLTEARSPDTKLVGNCRDFSVLLCAMLRHQGVPARARCGFGTYFLPDHFEDHWVCEYWQADMGRWVMVDAQLDAFQRESLAISFNPLDLPAGQFVTGGQAWEMCRSGQADPDRFGIFDMHGLWFVCGNLIRDFLALNRVEILPWDGGFGFLVVEQQMEAELMDRIAALTLAGDVAFSDIRAAYEADSRFHVPNSWYSQP